MSKVILALCVLFLLIGCTTSEQPRNCFDGAKLEAKEFSALKNAGGALANFKSEYSEMSAYINFLNGFVADYTKYISATSGATTAINYMPIPYAGQISSAANFGTKVTTLAANASRSVAILNNSIKEFESKLAIYNKELNTKNLLTAQKYASQTLQNDINNAREALIRLKEGASSLLGVSSALFEYYASTGELMSKAANIFSKKDTKEKRIANNKTLKDRNDNFEKKLTILAVDFETAKDYIKQANTISELKKEF